MYKFVKIGGTAELKLFRPNIFRIEIAFLIKQMKISILHIFVSLSTSMYKSTISD